MIVIINITLHMTKIDLKIEVWLKVGCLLYAVGKQPFIPLINHGRKWMLR